MNAEETSFKSFRFDGLVKSSLTTQVNQLKTDCQEKMGGIVVTSEAIYGTLILSLSGKELQLRFAYPRGGSSK
jgi:hypothetical protein